MSNHKSAGVVDFLLPLKTPPGLNRQDPAIAAFDFRARACARRESGLGLVNGVVLARMFPDAQAKGLAGAGLVHVNVIDFHRLDRL
jgi:hypothetical protein